MVFHWGLDPGTFAAAYPFIIVRPCSGPSPSCLDSFALAVTVTAFPPTSITRPCLARLPSSQQRPFVIDPCLVVLHLRVAIIDHRLLVPVLAIMRHHHLHLLELHH